MTVLEFQHVLGWCIIINYAVLVLWFVVFISAHDPLYRLHSRWFNLPLQTFDALHYGAMMIYKIGILLFVLVPWLALHLSGGGS